MTALVILADGCEEIEAVTIVDVLRRGGVVVTTASLSGDLRVAGAHNVAIGADVPFAPETAADYDAVALPGGMRCMESLRSRAYVLAALRSAAAAGRIVGAVCASPAVLGAAGLLEDRRFCCYPGIEAQIDAMRSISSRSSELDINRAMTQLRDNLALAMEVSDAETAAVDPDVKQAWRSFIATLMMLRCGEQAFHAMQGALAGGNDEKISGLAIPDGFPELRK